MVHGMKCDDVIGLLKKIAQPFRKSMGVMGAFHSKACSLKAVSFLARLAVAEASLYNHDLSSLSSASSLLSASSLSSALSVSSCPGHMPYCTVLTFCTQMHSYIQMMHKKY